MATLDELLERALAQGANALLLKPGEPPTIRVHGAYCALPVDPLTPDDTRTICESVVDATDLSALADDDEACHTVFVSTTGAAFEVSVFWWEGGVRAAFRPMAESSVAQKAPLPSVWELAPIPLAPPRMPPQGPLGGEEEQAEPSTETGDWPGDAAVPAMLAGVIPPRAGLDAKPLPRDASDVEPPREPSTRRQREGE